MHKIYVSIYKVYVKIYKAIVLNFGILKYALS